MPSPDDPYSRIQYRRLIAWPERIEREGPLLLEVLSSGPSRRILDLGCGTGEHSRWLAGRGFEVVGVDRSPAMLEAAREGDLPPGLSFLEVDLLEIGERVEGSFGGAICLGNTLPHLDGEGDLERLAAGLRRRLEPGAPLLLQVLNYERIAGRGQRYLPLNFRPDGEDEMVFLRLMRTRPDGSVLFFPTSLRLRPDAEPPLEIVASRRVELRGWTRPQIEAALSSAGFGRFEAFGSFDRAPYSAEKSPDLLLLAR